MRSKHSLVQRLPPRFLNYLTKVPQWKKRYLFTVIFVLVIIILFPHCQLCRVPSSENYDVSNIFIESRLKIQNTMTPGDCQAIGPRRPLWDNTDEIIQQLPEFANVYDGRPFRENKGGMRFSHSFGLWYTLRAITPRPAVVIESGAKNGHSTWVIRQALPDARIITINPSLPTARYKNVKYFAGDHFKDFNQIDWVEEVDHRQNVVILFDDHQSAYRRIFQEASKHGFRKFIFDDNCSYQQCDALSVKWMCETKRKAEWMGYIRDNFAKVVQNQTWDEHIRQSKELERLKVYYEFPPVIGDRSGVKALLQNRESFNRLLGPLSKNESEFRSYAFMCYLEL